MSDRPIRCPFCSNTVLSTVDDARWACVGTLGCGGVWDPTVVLAAPIRLARDDEDEERRPPRSRRAIALRTKKKLVKRPRPRLPDAA